MFQLSDVEFRGYPKTPRLYRECVVTEKIDGSSCAVVVTEGGDVYAQSRNRLLDWEAGVDNFEFARWVHDNADALVELLGVGYHYGEWWGYKINRGYGLSAGDRRFSLFDTDRYGDVVEEFWAVEGLGLVPVLGRGVFGDSIVQDSLRRLRREGSKAVEGYLRPEGVIVTHIAGRQRFKVLLEGDDTPKGSGSGSRSGSGADS